MLPVQVGSPLICTLLCVFPGLDLFYTDLAQHLTTADFDLQAGSR